MFFNNKFLSKNITNSCQYLENNYKVICTYKMPSTRLSVLSKLF